MSYHDLLDRELLLTRKLLNQEYHIASDSVEVITSMTLRSPARLILTVIEYLTVVYDKESVTSSFMS